MPWRTAAGTDLVRDRGWRTVACPYTGEEVLAIPAARLQVTVIQVERCDEDGNVELPHPRQLSHDLDHMVCRAADRVIVCAERVEPIPHADRVVMIGREVDLVVHAPRGAWPGGMEGLYPPDFEHLRTTYLPQTAESAKRYVAGVKEALP
jgi:glutaconate CoA-transferase subunit A